MKAQMTTGTGERGGLTTLSRPRADAPGHDHVRLPTVPQPKARWMARVALPVLILLLFGGVLAYAARGMLSPAIDVHVVPVVPRSASIATGEISSNTTPVAATVSVQAPGWIEPDPYATTVTALIDGVVSEILVLEGEPVEADQVVAKLIDDDAAIALQIANALVAESESALARTRAVVHVADAGVRVDQSALDALQDEVDRKRLLAENGRVSAGEFRRLELQLHGAQAKLAQAVSSLEETKAGVAQMEAALQSAKAMRAEAELRMQRTQVKSPVAGVVLARLVEPGTRLSMSQSSSGESNSMSGGVLRIYNPAKLQVRVDVPLTEAAKIGLGTLAQVTTEALPNSTFAGRVTRVVHEANIQRNTVQFKVAIENPSPQLKPEMLCRVKLQGTISNGSGSQPQANGASGDGVQLLIPAAVLQNPTDDRAMVWVVEYSTHARQLRAQQRQIEFASSGANEVVVHAGLQPGDRVIVNPPASLRHGAVVRILSEHLSDEDQHEGQINGDD